jgi:hypothetical protein
VPQKTYTYYHPESRGLDFAGLMNDIKVIHFFSIFTSSILFLLTSSILAASCINLFKHFCYKISWLSSYQLSFSCYFCQSCLEISYVHL